MPRGIPDQSEHASDLLQSRDPFVDVQGSNLLSATGRYVHATAYLDQLAGRNNFKVRCMKRSSLRLENSRAVAGWLAIREA